LYEHVPRQPLEPLNFKVIGRRSRSQVAQFFRDKYAALAIAPRHATQLQWTSFYSYFLSTILRSSYQVATRVLPVRPSVCPVRLIAQKLNGADKGKLARTFLRAGVTFLSSKDRG